MLAKPSKYLSSETKELNSIMADIIIRNGRIIDGTGNPWYHGDVAIKGGSIEAIGNVTEDAPTIINAQDMCVCPGFIDMHAHPDLTLFYKEVQDYKLRQGITTEVGGNCGFTAAPLNSSTAEALKKYTAFITPPKGVTWSWSTFSEYLEAVDISEPPTNLAPLVGHGTVRIAVMGFQQRKPTPKELRKMQALVQESMEAGAFGLSTGLVYVPGTYADTNEIVSLAHVASKYGGIYATHMRDEGDHLLESIEEAIDIGRRASMPIQISHHKATGQANHGKVYQSLELIRLTREQGIDISLDQYPYSAGSTTLQVVLPPWAQEGGVDEVINRLSNAETRSRVKAEILNDVGEIRLGGKLEDILITSVATASNQRFMGLSIQEISDLRNQSALDLVLDLLVEEDCAVGMVVFSMSEEDVRTVMASPYTMIGTDGLFQVGNPHPRVYGSYPRILGKYVREDKLLSLEAAVRKMTSFPAQKLGLFNKGILRPGSDADIVVFDSDSVIDHGTYRHPHKYPTGIEYVLVNGKVSVAEGHFTGVTAGQVLKR